MKCSQSGSRAQNQHNSLKGLRETHGFWGRKWEIWRWPLTCFSVFAQFQVNNWSTMSCALAYRHHEAELGGLMWCWELLLSFAGRGGSDPKRCWAFTIPLDSAASALSAALEMHTTASVSKGCCLLELCISSLLKHTPWMFLSYFLYTINYFWVTPWKISLNLQWSIMYLKIQEQQNFVLDRMYFQFWSTSSCKWFHLNWSGNWWVNWGTGREMTLPKLIIS